jgi:hypothetical protein
LKSGLDASLCPAIDTPFGPDGLPAVFEGGTWRSHDGSFVWNGVAWMPATKKPATGSWLIRIGASIVMVALLGYAIYTTVATNSEFAIGYYLGAVIFFAVLLVIYRFAGRWGCFGIVIRAGCFLLALLKVLTLVTHHPPA